WKRRGYLGLLAIDLIRIEPPLRVDKGQSRAALALVHRTIETGVPAGVTGRAGLFDLDPDRILIAIHPHLDHALSVAGAFALAPQRVAGAAEIPGLAAGDGFAQR